MKSRILLATILLGLTLTSFNTRMIAPEKANTFFAAKAIEGGLFGEDYCALAVIISLTENGEEISSKFIRHRFYFCPDQTLTVYNDSYSATGRWVNEPGRVLIDVNAPDEGLYWLSGYWQKVEHSENVLELEKSGKDGYYRVRFERMQR